MVMHNEPLNFIFKEFIRDLFLRFRSLKGKMEPGKGKMEWSLCWLSVHLSIFVRRFPSAGKTKPFIQVNKKTMAALFLESNDRGLKPSSPQTLET